MARSIFLARCSFVMSLSPKIIYPYCTIDLRHMEEYIIDMKTCSFPRCERQLWSNGLCRPHSTHLYRYGEPRVLTSDPNEIIIEGDVAKIILYNRDGSPSGKIVLIDSEDVLKISGLRFYVSHGYAKVSSSKTTYLHRIVNPCEHPLVCDHINQNKLDCRKKNLRCVSRAENMKNMDISLHTHRWKKTAP